MALNNARSQAGMLVYFHCRSNTKYAIGPLEGTFFEVGAELVGASRVHFAYPELDSSPPAFLPAEHHHRVIQFEPRTGHSDRPEGIERYLREHGIEIGLGFDQQVNAPGNRVLRRGGIRTLVSYWGAEMSSLNHGLRLLSKRLQVLLTRHRPDHFVFESEAMRVLAVQGRGVPRSETSVCPLGVDTDRFKPADAAVRGYAHSAFGIPLSRRIVYYAGHFEPRKGVDVILRATKELVDDRGREDVHVLLLGNRPEDEARLRPIVAGSRADHHVTFAGYRDDAPRLTAASDVAVIASVGWDSFPRTSIEVAAAGLPLVASRLQGLIEAVDDGVTGFLFKPGDHTALADHLASLLDDDALRHRMAAAARERVLARFSLARQREGLVEVIQRVRSRGG